MALRGTFSVASAHKLVNTIGLDIQEHEIVILDFTDTVYMDDSAAMVVEQLVEIAIDEDTACIGMGLSGQAAGTLEALNVLAGCRPIASSRPATRRGRRPAGFSRRRRGAPGGRRAVGGGSRAHVHAPRGFSISRQGVDLEWADNHWRFCGWGDAQAGSGVVTGGHLDAGVCTSVHECAWACTG